MGNGIAHVCALAGLPVILLDAKEAALTSAMATIARNMDRQVNRGIIATEDRDAALARITTSTDYAAFDERRPGDRGGDGEGGHQAGDLQAAYAASEADLPAGVQHLVDLDHPARRRRPTGRRNSSACTS